MARNSLARFVITMLTLFLSLEGLLASGTASTLGERDLGHVSCKDGGGSRKLANNCNGGTWSKSTANASTSSMWFQSLRRKQGLSPPPPSPLRNTARHFFFKPPPPRPPPPPVPPVSKDERGCSHRSALAPSALPPTHS
ncbi:hypothetical protein RJ641_002767 [Dillenia turbinata]|uniref:Uncharacterized protein n=1 Tax=Dillenia turbinata TaxID=194707 RepID=A0AAN8Z8U1_9MAGN